MPFLTLRLLVLFFCLLTPQLASATTADNTPQSIWQDYLLRYKHSAFVIGDSHSLRQLVDYEKQAIVTRRGHLYKVTQRSRYFAHYLLNRCLEEGLPVEIALVPMVESAFDPFAFSQGGAAGLWQFMQRTGKHFGLTESWWFDDRRDPIRSTDAAISYFKRLYNRFDDWALAIAAYNAGPTRISRAVKKNLASGGSGQFAELELPQETRSYLPRLLALRELLISNSSAVSIFPVTTSAYFEVIELSGQMDLGRAAALSDGSVAELYHLNAGLNQWATPPLGPHRLLVPAEDVETFRESLRNVNDENWFDWQLVEVESGDTLGEIAQAFNSDIAYIKMANTISDSRINIGQKLLVPVPSKENPERSNSGLTASLQKQLEQMRTLREGVRRIDYTVVSGDSWWLVARRFGVSMNQLLEWNTASASQVLRPGRGLVIWQPVEGHRRSIARTIYYKVRRGDSLAGIAQRFNVSAQQIIARNALNPERYLQPGQKLSISVPIVGHRVGSR